MPREKADELARQLQDPESWLLTKGKHRKAMKSAAMQSVEALGQRLSHTSFRDEVEERIKTKSGRSRVVTFGKGDKGAIATLVGDKKEAKWMKKQMDNVTRKLLEDVEFTEVQEHPEYLDIEFSVDIMSAGMGRTIVETLRQPETCTKIADLMAIMEGIDTNVSVVSPAASRKLADMEVIMKWNPKPSKTETMIQEVDCSCIIYAEEHLVHATNFSSPIQQDATEPVKKDNYHFEEMLKSVRRALTHCSDTSNKEARLRIDLSALPLEVTDMYFVISTFEADDLSNFSGASLSLVDLARDQELTNYACDLGCASTSSVVCSLSRHDNGWVVMGVGVPCNAGRNMESLLAVLAERQGRHLNWERRRELVKLRVLHKCQRMSRCSDADFAMLMQKIMELPVAVFQSLMKFM
ncbi:unnamed protein product [Effrenium voratum]|nr:unnamed protein product [Effrenium voratum]